MCDTEIGDVNTWMDGWSWRSLSCRVPSDTQRCFVLGKGVKEFHPCRHYSSLLEGIRKLFCGNMASSPMQRGIWVSLPTSLKSSSCQRGYASGSALAVVLTSLVILQPQLAYIQKDCFLLLTWNGTISHWLQWGLALRCRKKHISSKLFLLWNFLSLKVSLLNLFLPF